MLLAVQGLFAKPPANWKPEQQIFLMRALQPLDLLTERAFHLLLSRLFSQRHIDLLRSILDDQSLGFDIVRGYHRVQLASYTCDKSIALHEIERLRDLSRNSFLATAILSQAIIHYVKEGAVYQVERELADLDSETSIKVSNQALLGACNLLIREKMHACAASFLERHLRSLDADQQLYFLEPLLQLDGLSALPPSLSVFCRRFRPPVGLSVTQALSHVYSAVDEADGTRFRALVIEPLAALHGGNPNLMDVRFCSQERRSLINKIIGHLTSKTPLSLIRLNDGEAYAFPNPCWEGLDSGFFDADNSLRERHWWGASPPPDIATEIKHAVRHAVEACDIIGLPSVHRVVGSLARPNFRYGDTHQQRGLMTVLAGLGTVIPLRGKIATEERCHHCVLSESALANLARAAESVLVVSC